MEPVTQTIIFAVALVIVILSYELRIKVLKGIIESKDGTIYLLKDSQQFRERQFVPIKFLDDHLSLTTPPIVSADNAPCD